MSVFESSSGGPRPLCEGAHHQRPGSTVTVSTQPRNTGTTNDSPKWSGSPNVRRGHFDQRQILHLVSLVLRVSDFGVGQMTTFH